MPELPEVETVRRGLIKRVVGRKILNFKKKDNKVVQFEPKDIEGQQIKNIERRAKILIFELTDKIMIAHLKMTGQFIWEKCPGEIEFCLRQSKRMAGGHPDKAWFEKLPNKHTRAIFHFDDKSVLYFNDIRRFGWLKIPQTSNLKAQSLSELDGLGAEPYSKDFNLEYLKKQTKRYPNRKIKQFIMDQSIIAGVGNIYSDEALFYAGIKPIRMVKNIKNDEWSKIISSVLKALDIGIKYHGSSSENYVDAEGKAGRAHLHVKVYRRTGEKCHRAGCSGTIKRIVVGGRSTHYCPECQT